MTSRRRFLALLAAAPAAAQIDLLVRKGPAQRVVVLGAGLAGLCSAYELTQQGHQVTVLEAKAHPGGRVRTLRENYAPGLFTEAGAESIPGAHEITQHYARTFGLNLLPFITPGLRSFYHIGGKRIVPAANTVWPYDLTPEERAMGFAGLRKKYLDAAVDEALAAGYEKQPVKALAAFDRQTPGAWLRSKGASKGAAELLALGFGTDFGSAASFMLHRLNTMGGTASYRIEGGNDRLPHELARRVDVRYGAAVTGVTQNERGVEVHFRAAAGPEKIVADRAICALPCPVMGNIFADARISAAKQRAIREQYYSRTCKIFLQTRTRFWRKDGWNGFVTTDLPIERLTPDPGTEESERGALTAYAMAGYTADLERMDEAGRIAAALDQTRQIFPEMSREFEGGVAKCWGLDPWQKGSFSLHTPGQIGFVDTLAERDGRIHFAGEHTSHWCGWMQGALHSARRVVAEING